MHYRRELRVWPTASAYWVWDLQPGGRLCQLLALRPATPRSATKAVGAEPSGSGGLPAAGTGPSWSCDFPSCMVHHGGHPEDQVVENQGRVPSPALTVPHDAVKE